VEAKKIAYNSNALLHILSDFTQLLHGLFNPDGSEPAGATLSTDEANCRNFCNRFGRFPIDLVKSMGKGKL